MTIKAGGRMALIAATGLLVCVAVVSGTTAASSAPEQKSEYVSTSKKLKQVRYYKRYAHRKYARTAQTSSEEKKPVEVAEAGLPSELPASVANANARMGEITDTARAMTARANALLTSDQPTEGQGAVTTMQVAEADQLNDADKALQESAQPSQTTVAVAPTKPVATAKPAPSETSTWDQTSLIGKIFIAFGALLTVASAARMFMA
jgi:hypothetical protein